MAQSNFDELKGKLAKKKGVFDPAALAAKIGMEKDGKAAFEAKAAAGRHKAAAKRAMQKHK